MFGSCRIRCEREVEKHGVESHGCRETDSGSRRGNRGATSKGWIAGDRLLAVGKGFLMASFQPYGIPKAKPVTCGAWIIGSGGGQGVCGRRALAIFDRASRVGRSGCFCLSLMD